MEEQFAVQNLLRTHLLSAQSKNPRFSLRSYARLLGIHPGALSAIMNGKRNVSRDMAEKISRKLLVDPQTRTEILGKFPEKRRYRNTAELRNDQKQSYLEIEASAFRMIAEWEHFAVLSLVKTRGFRDCPEWIGKRLGVTKFRALEVVERLITLGFLEKKNGGLRRVSANLRTSDDTLSISIQKSHEEGLELAGASLQRDPVLERDFTSITMAIDPAKLKAAKEMIRKFQDDLSRTLETGEQKEVYRLSMQLFPLSRPLVKTNKENLQ